MVHVVSIAEGLTPDFSSPNLPILLHIQSQTTKIQYILCTEYIFQSSWKAVHQHAPLLNY